VTDVPDGAIPPPRSVDAERQQLLATRHGLMLRANASPESPSHADAVSGLLADLNEQYLAGLPVIELSRNPHTGQLLNHSIDLVGLDGPWWDANAPVRPFEPVDGPLVGFTGAIALDPTVEHTEFLVKPGPAVPYVIPQLLADPEVTAVLSALTIGAHAGYTICYFARGATDVASPDDWGRNRHDRTTADGRPGWNENPLTEDDYDFDLRPWVDAGRLQWIVPGDPTLELHATTDDCPYLDLDGTQYVQRLKQGRVWHLGTIE